MATADKRFVATNNRDTAPPIVHFSDAAHGSKGLVDARATLVPHEGAVRHEGVDAANVAVRA